MDVFILTVWTRSSPIEETACEILLLLFFIGISVFNADSVDPDQTPRYAASDPGQHCQCSFYGTLGINGLINHFVFTFLFCS